MILLECPNYTLRRGKNVPNSPYLSAIRGQDTSGVANSLSRPGGVESASRLTTSSLHAEPQSDSVPPDPQDLSRPESLILYQSLALESPASHGSYRMNR